MQISKMQERDYNSICPTCNYGHFQVPANGQEWHLECDTCPTILFCYMPMDHQAFFHEDESKYRMFAGGYGSAKTTTACAEIIRHVLETPRGTTLIGAATLPQLEQTCQKTFFEMFPEQLIETHNKQKNYIDTVTGHRVIFRPLDDEGKARSMNLTAFWIEEASEVGYEYFVQLQTRLRNNSTDFHIGVLSTNPDLGWIRTDFLMVSKVYNSEDFLVQDEEEINPTFATHIAPTKLNIYLPKNYEEDTARGKPEWWIKRYLQGSFSHAEGLVYPMYNQHTYSLQERFPDGIPKHWEKAQASDFGLVDPTTAIWGAIDPATGDVYLYEEYYQTEEAVSYHSEQMLEVLKDIPVGRLRFLVGDPKAAHRSLKDKSTTFDHYAEYGVYFEPASNAIDAGIMKVYTWLTIGKLHIADHLKMVLYEFERYKYPEKKLEKKKTNGQKPIDVDNHLMDAIRYFVQELPDDPKYLINPSYLGKVSDKRVDQTYLPHALQDDDSSYTDSWLSY